MNDSKITHYTDGGTLIEGEDGIELFRALSLWSALGLAAHGITLNRHLTRKKLLAAATSYTQKPYPNTVAGLVQARRDVKVWADAMNAAIPHEVKP